MEVATADRELPGKPAESILRRLLRMLAAVVMGFVLVCSLLLLGCQHKLIYHPEPYQPIYRNMLPEGAREIAHRTSQGSQTFFYIPPEDDPEAVPTRLWVMFGGNASLTLDWLDFVHRYPNRTEAFLLFDYPGYGVSEGRCSPRTILESSTAAYKVLVAELGETPQAVGVVGHSLGAAAALQFAAEHPADRVVLVAPFTSTMDMARRMVGPIFAHLLHHRFDNRARLQELAARETPPRVLLLHGDNDPVIPVEMGRELASLHPEMITYVEVKGGSHDVVFNTRPRIWESMTETILEEVPTE